MPTAIGLIFGFGIPLLIIGFITYLLISSSKKSAAQGSNIIDKSLPGQQIKLVDAHQPSKSNIQKQATQIKPQNKQEPTNKPDQMPTKTNETSRRPPANKEHIDRNNQNKYNS